MITETLLERTLLLRKESLLHSILGYCLEGIRHLSRFRGVTIDGVLIGEWIY
jgi:hypothetical protein